MYKTPVLNNISILRIIIYMLKLIPKQIEEFQKTHTRHIEMKLIMAFQEQGGNPQIDAYSAIATNALHGMAGLQGNTQCTVANAG
jgi:hypothetical protein